MNLGDFFSSDITGLDETIKMFDRLKNMDAKKTALKTAVAEGIQIALKYAKSIAPKQTGRFKGAIRTRVWRHPDAGEVGQKLFIYLGESREDMKGAWYGWIVESRQHIIDRAYEATSREMQEATVRALDKILREVLR